MAGNRVPRSAFEAGVWLTVVEQVAEAVDVKPLWIGKKSLPGGFERLKPLRKQVSSGA